MLPIYKSQTCIFRKKPLCKLPCENFGIWKVIALILKSAISYTKVIFILGNFKESLVYIFCNASIRVKYEIYVLSGVFEHVNHFILIKQNEAIGEEFSEGKNKHFGLLNGYFNKEYN